MANNETVRVRNRELALAIVNSWAFCTMWPCKCHSAECYAVSVATSKLQSSLTVNCWQCKSFQSEIQLQQNFSTKTIRNKLCNNDITIFWLL